MRLESIAKFHSPESPMTSDSSRATTPDSLSNTDMMAVTGMAQPQTGFGVTTFCSKHELSQSDRREVINYLIQFTYEVPEKYRSVAKLEGNAKTKVL